MEHLNSIALNSAAVFFLSKRGAVGLWFRPVERAAGSGEAAGSKRQSALADCDGSPAKSIPHSYDISL